MGKPKRALNAQVTESITPPETLTDSQSVARVVKPEGSNLFTCVLPNQKTVLVELEPLLRNTVWIKRGGYVLIDLASMEERNSRVVGDIVRVVQDEKAWRKQPYWPKQFTKSTYDEDEDGNCNVGKMPPSDSEGNET